MFEQSNPASVLHENATLIRRRSAALHITAFKYGGAKVQQIRRRKVQSSFENDLASHPRVILAQVQADRLPKLADLDASATIGLIKSLFHRLSVPSCLV
jgi:hypothetical protein